MKSLEPNLHNFHKYWNIEKYLQEPLLKLASQEQFQKFESFLLGKGISGDKIDNSQIQAIHEVLESSDDKDTLILIWLIGAHFITTETKYISDTEELEWLTTAIVQDQSRIFSMIIGNDMGRFKSTYDILVYWHMRDLATEDQWTTSSWEEELKLARLKTTQSDQLNEEQRAFLVQFYDDVHSSYLKNT